MSATRRLAVQPRKQGSLDSLCGVYAVVNAASEIAPSKFKAPEYGGLFSSLIAKLEYEKQLGEAILNGMWFKTVGQLVDAASIYLKRQYGFSLSRRVAFRSHDVTLDAYWKRLDKHISPDLGRVAIIGTSGRRDHWTCATRMSKDTLTVSDSAGIQRFRREKCTVADEVKGRHHVLWPTQTYLLSRVDNPD